MSKTPPTTGVPSTSPVCAAAACVTRPATSWLSIGLGNLGSWRFLYYNDDLGAKYLRRLVTEMDIVFAQDERQMMDWLAAGKYQINLLAKIENTASARKQGLPVAQIFSEKEGDAIASGSGHISVFKDGPIPMRRSFTSTGFCHATVNSVGRNTPEETHFARIFRRTCSNSLNYRSPKRAASTC